MVTLVQAQLKEMTGACNQLHHTNREIPFIVLLSKPNQVIAVSAPPRV